MKKSTLVKFSLTLVSAAVLAACGSSGGKGNDVKKPVVDQQAQAAAKAKAEAEAKAKAEAEAKAKAEAQKQLALSKTVSVGHKLVKKNDSNFVLGIKNDQMSSSTGRADIMDVVLYPSLDTVVVSQPLKKDANGNFVIDPKAPVGYLEDFDFRGNTANASGKYTLQHIYKTDGNTLNTGKAGVRAATETKTASAGQQTGDVLVYQEGRKVYIPTDEAVTSDGKAVVAAQRDRSKTVAEVYGHRTFVEGDSLKGVDANGKITGGEKGINNAPFGKKNAKGEYVEGVRLDHVQYGRVTSKLNEVKREVTKNGVDAGNYGTKVVSYGEYGAKGTESSYFYRGVGDTAYNKDLAGKLAKDYATYNAKGEMVNADKLTYQGHAVTYGFAHSTAIQAEGNLKPVPNALGANKPAELATLVSGTHVKADIDLATKAVDGKLYDVWSNGAQTIATFNGMLENDGTIAGSSKRVAGGEGTFNANLFGKNAEELGGALASKATDVKNSWGAVFGAKVQNVPGTKPLEKEDSAWGVKTDANK